LKIGVAYDVFRSPRLGQWDPAGHAAWLRAFISPALNAVGATVAAVFDDPPKAIVEWLDKRVAAGDVAAGPNSWFDLFSGSQNRRQLEMLFEPMLAYDLIVGYEMTPNQIRFLSQHAQPFIDIGIDPIRFTGEAFLRARSNCRALSDTLLRFQNDDEDLLIEAGIFRARLARQSRDEGGSERNLVFVGQVDVDSSLIAQSTIAGVTPHLDTIAEMLRRHDQMIVQPHPLAHINADVLCLLRQFSRAVVGRGSVYKTVCAPATRTVVTLSSSVADEASLFGIPVMRLLQPDNSSEALGEYLCLGSARIDANFASKAFWATATLSLREGAPMRPPTSTPRLSKVTSHLRNDLGVFIAPATRDQTNETLAPNTLINMSNPSHVAAYCAFGWSGAEELGVWSIGPLAIINFVTPLATAHLELLVAGFIGPADRVLNVQLLWSGLADGSAPVRHGRMVNEDEQLLVIALPEKQPTSRYHLTIRVATPCAPASLGLSDDTRELGIRLSWLRLVA
jgi:hypothetical protein